MLNNFYVTSMFFLENNFTNNSVVLSINNFSMLRITENSIIKFILNYDGN